MKTQVTSYCISAWCITAGFLIDTLSVISVIIGIMVGLVALVVNIKKLK